MFSCLLVRQAGGNASLREENVPGSLGRVCSMNRG